MKFIIKNLADNEEFPHNFDSIEEAEEFLIWNLNDQNLNYDENRAQYEICKVTR